jgi:chemotaxis response regulator CheB
VPLPIRVLLADEPGVCRIALARVLADASGIEVVEGDGCDLRDALRRLRPDVLVIDDRLLRHRDRVPADEGVRVIVVGVDDDDPAYAARAASVGAARRRPPPRGFRLRIGCRPSRRC